MRRFLAGLTLGFLAGFVAQPVWAHGTADWIRMHPDFSWCCTPEDCGVYPAEKVRVVPGGFIVEEGEFIPHSEGKPSVDENYWRCVAPDKKTRCFFFPNVGS